jgi:uncharacterized protein
MLQQQISLAVSQQNWAIVGVSDDFSKFGRRIFENLKSAGYHLTPIHPKLTSLSDGTPVYQNLSSLPVKPEVVNLVIPPAATEAIVDDCIALGINTIWFQPGSEYQPSIDKATAAGLTVIAHGPCAMVEKQQF